MTSFIPKNIKLNRNVATVSCTDIEMLELRSEHIFDSAEEAKQFTDVIHRSGTQGCVEGHYFDHAEQALEDFNKRH